ncbi:MAG: pentapeptide repeat-containing protein [Cyanobacteria bacterium SBLK]|nr:pentapeptide repeat-containing protein [Cyanobacteria bacterium SBLK]
MQQPQVRKLLQTGNGYEKSFLKADMHGAYLKGVNLEEANLKQADLSDAILHDANLKNVNLTDTLAIGTDFTGAYLTGACLEAWNIDSSTILDRVDCQYIFLLEKCNVRGSRERRPHDSYKTFDPGDFEKLYQQLMDTVQLLLKNGVNPEAF